MSEQPLYVVARPNLSTATDEEIAEFAASVWEKFSTISPSVSLGRRRDQISIWDVINTEEIQTGGKGADVEKHDRRSNPEAAVEDDGRRRPGVGEAGPRAVSQTGRPTVAVVKFAPGLVPVLKHGTTHNEADHGRRRGSSSAEMASRALTGT